MNPIDASKLLQLLEGRIDKSKPLKPQLCQHFVPAFWNGNVILRESWRGKIISWLQRPSELKANEQKIICTFAQAFFSVSNDSKELEKVNIDLGIKLHEELMQVENYIDMDNDSSLDPALTTTPETKALNSLKESQKTAYWKKVRENSLLRNTTSPGESIPLDLDTFRALFISNHESHPELALAYLEKFLAKNPRYGTQGWQEKLSSIRKSSHEDHQLIKSMQSEENLSTPAEKIKKLREESVVMSSSVRGMPAGKKKLLQFSYGPKNLSMAALFQALKQMPKSTLDSFPKPIRELILDDKAHDTKEVAEKIIHHFFDEVRSNLSQEKLKINRQGIGPLLENTERKVPEYVAMALPQIFELYLENILKKGVVGNIASLIPEENSRKALEWISQNGDRSPFASGSKRTDG